MKQYNRQFLLFFFCAFAAIHVQAQNPLEDLSLDTIILAENLDIPWDMEWAGNDEILFTEIGGAISRLNISTGEVVKLHQLTDVAQELQAGLMGMALHPNFDSLPEVFIAYSYYGNGNALFLRLQKMYYDQPNNTLTPMDVLVENIPSSPRGTGARILITPDEKLYLSVGDLDVGENAQDSTSLNGKILRYHLDGSIPVDNPFGNAVWSMGHRNPQGLILGDNGRLYVSEHGPSNNDEINAIQPGRNYGWPIISGKCAWADLPLCDSLSLQNPVEAWTPTVAPCGIAWYSDTLFTAWQNSLLVTNLKDQGLLCVKLAPNGLGIEDQYRYLGGVAGRMRDVLVNPDGRVFVCTSNNDIYGIPRPGGDKIIELVEGELDIFTPDPDNMETYNVILDSTQLEVNVVAQNLTLPWDMHWGSDDWIWFSERKGNIKKMNPETGEVKAVHYIDDVYESSDNSGLHGFALHPNFPDTPYMYVNYTHSFTKARLIKLTYDTLTQTVIDTSHLLPNIDANVTHNGSRIVFMEDGTLLFSVGDAFLGAAPLDTFRLPGKIIRLNDDGSIPDDNPFPNNPVWSMGHRNPQGLVVASNGQVYSSEHGPANDDELNLIIKGRNYGWPEVSGLCDLLSEEQFCADNNIVEPLVIWTPTSAPCGLTYYDHPAIPEWQNSLLQTFLKAGDGGIGQRLKQLKLNEAGTEIIESNDFFTQAFGRIRDVLVAPDGRIFLCTSNRETNGQEIVAVDDDKIIELRVKPKDPSNPNPLYNISVYPNPARNSITLDFGGLSNEDLHLVLYDVTGRLVLEKTLRLTGNNETLQRGKLTAGVYFLQTQFREEKPLVQRVIFE